MRTLLLLSTLVGLALAATLLGSVGLAPVLAAVGRIGFAGFAVFTLYTLLVLGVLGAAWWAVAPGLSLDALPSFVWGRMTREAATDLLPFAQIGGLVVGGRTVTATAIRSLSRSCRIVPAELGDNAGIFGGAAIVLQEMAGER